MNSKKQKPSQGVREQPLTYDDYAAVPDDGQRYELVNGRLELMAPAPSPKHQLIAKEIGSTLDSVCGSDYILLYAPIDVILSDTDIRQPDIVMIHKRRAEFITHRGIEGPPDLVVEVLSTSSVKRDRGSKVKSYARYGIPEYWIVDPINRILEQYILNSDSYELEEVYDGDKVIHSERLPCVAFTMKDIINSLPELPNA
ncbi:Uma2 family endonuclease [Scopulibacillus darangshiensis]|uniref:Uma2 family endonuclease n=1 Tax=Scopulibacillus darangshiensis TaxID=442528 RepID=A0A4V6NQF6_9BACL|nr:Uma2 family endonuclease [Scopulibacillus darangshiensis]TCP21166.1 Uma2 family endonuclease [Scopulibacillus darangshiensis]